MLIDYLMEEEIKRLQVEIKTKLTNIIIANPLTNSRKTGIVPQRSRITKPIFKDYTTHGAIYDMKVYTPEYKAFLEFMNSEFSINNSSYQQNSGDILTFHCYDPSGQAELQKITEIYKENFISPLENSTRSHFTNTKGQKYPNFIEDLLLKTRKIVYEKAEKDIGIGNIQEQTDAEFINTIKKRVEGLKRCSTNDISDADRAEYYREEHDAESKYLTEPEMMTLSTSNPTKFIEEFCKNIKWGSKSLKYYKEDKDDFEDFKTFVVNNSSETLFLKTIFPRNCFDNTGNINWDELEQLYKDPRHYHRQFFFGFGEDISAFKPFKKVYEVMNMNFGNLKNCSELINWTIFLNFFYTKCAIALGTQIPSSIRMILPKKDFTIIKLDSTHNTPPNYIVNIRGTRQVSGLFTPKSKLKFIGFINIKFVHDQNPNNVSFRNWTLFVFHNPDITDYTFIDFLTGNGNSYPILTNSMNICNTGSILEHDSITYEELKHFNNVLVKEGLTFYMSQIDNITMFISKVDNLDTDPYYSSLKLAKITLSKDVNPLKSAHRYSRGYSILSGSRITSQSGGSINFKYNQKKSIDMNNTIDIGLFNKYLDTTIIIDEFPKKLRYECYKKIYKFLLISADEITYNFLNTEDTTTKYNIAKYITLENKLFSPVSYKFYSLYEILKSFNLFKIVNNKNSILNIGYNLSVVEILNLYNYKINNVDCIIPNSTENYYKYTTDKWKKYIQNMKTTYNFNLVFHENSNYNLINNELLTNKKYNMIIYTNYFIDKDLYIFENFYNTINIFIGALIGLKYTAPDGVFIIHFGNVVYCQTADIYLILKRYFMESHLYYPEIANLAKNSGVMGVFKGFKGCPDKVIMELESILADLQTSYPNNTQDFNVYEPNLRAKYKILKPMEPSSKRHKYITGFLDIPDTDVESVYREIIDFNNKTYLEKLLFVQKVVYLLTNPEESRKIKTPTPDQITSSILYCKKYDIPYFDKFNSSKINNFISRNILSEMYGLHEPILYKFKTPFKTARDLATKIILKPHFSKIHGSSNSSSIHSGILKSITPIGRTRKHTRKTSQKKTAILKSQLSIGSILRDMFETKKSNMTTKATRISPHRSHISIYRISSKFHRGQVSLMDPIFPSNNQLVQVGRLIDSRRDFSKATKRPGEKYDPQTQLYDQLKYQFRYYKGKGTNRNVPNLDITVQQRLGDSSISQAWLKMYEIITDCELVPQNQTGTFHSFHLCEAPGTFINALNNYIRTKTQYSGFEWHAQSLNTKHAKIGDTFGLIKRHPQRWDWGATGTGDITQVENIRYYKSQIEKRPPVKLITSDCGLEWGNPKYEHVAFASYVAILDILPKGGTMIYKILSPIDVPLIWNLIYMTFTNFKDMAFFKPVQNAQSREFYIVAKDYLGTSPDVMDKLLDIVDRWDKIKGISELDLFGDSYPEEFVVQVIKISEQLSQNYVSSIERIIYYMDNMDHLGDEYKRHIEKYIQEKNEDWLRTYKPRRLEHKWVL